MCNRKGRKAMNIEDRSVTLYNKDTNEPAVIVILTEDGYKKYKDGEAWDTEWIECMIDYKAILKADFS